MRLGGVGGGSTATGLTFERDVDFQSLLRNVPGYEIKPILGKPEMVFISRAHSLQGASRSTRSTSTLLSMESIGQS